MAFDRLENIVIEQESTQPAEIVLQSPPGPAPPEKEKRITAHDLFTFFTATIIRQNEPFVR